MPLFRIFGIFVAAASAGMAGCASLPLPERERVAASVPFAAQVERVAGALQRGARDRYPDLAQRVPGLANGGFDIYVIAGGEPGSASSASGQIALNAALGTLQPYDDWLAFVIACEMGHVIARHHDENSSAGIAASVILNILLPGSGLLKSAASTIGSELAVSGIRERQAQEAVDIAAQLLEAAGFRLRDVALSRAIAPAGADEGRWSMEFAESAARLTAAARGQKLRGADQLAESASR